MKTMYLLAAALLLSACARMSDLHLATKGSGSSATETRTVTGFTKISLEGGMDVFVTQGANESVRIEADDNLLKLITTSLSAGELELSTSESIDPVTPVKVYITAKSLDGLSIAGSGKIVTETPFTTKDFDASIAGSGDIQANVIAEQIDASIAGSGNVILKGSTNAASVSVAGSGDVKGFDLVAKSVSVDIAGSGDCEITASEQLTGNIMGSGSIYYKGDPKLKSSVMGSGNIQKK